LLKKKEKDLELAAMIGKHLVDKEHKFETTIAKLEEQLAIRKFLFNISHYK
jgi:hypothetical protein